MRDQLHAFGLARDRLNLGHARSAGLSQADLHALEHVEAAGALTPGELQRRIGLTSGSVTALIDRLARAGWVVRTPNPADRRSVLVRLSPRAAAAEGPLAAYHAAVTDAASALSPAERETVSRFLAAVTEAAERAGDALWD